MFHFAAEAPGHQTAVYPKGGSSSGFPLKVCPHKEEKSKIHEPEIITQLTPKAPTGKCKDKTFVCSDTDSIKELWKPKMEAADSKSPMH